MDKVIFTINGETHSISGASVAPHTTLLQYVRARGLPGTKLMCEEGGCGACVLAVSLAHPDTAQQYTIAVNSCLVHVLSCHGWAVRTVEGVGGGGAEGGGHHPVQQRLAAFNGTQCGYCSPGWVNSMYCLLKSKKSLTMELIEKSFGGNMCRCTGYRPILDAFKTFATDLPLDPRLHHKLQDMEDLYKLKCFARDSGRCSVAAESWCVVERPAREQTMVLDLEAGARWYKVFELQDIFKILKDEGDSDYRLINGNTGKGVFPLSRECRVLIDVSSVSALRRSLPDMNLVLGAGLTLTELIDKCDEWAAHSDDFKYLQHFSKHLDLVAHVPVRNIGTIGGNLAMKNKHKSFQSDIFVLLETVRATVTVIDKTLKSTVLNMEDFLKMDLKGKLITEVKLPPLSTSHHIRTYKVMSRAQNVHAIVNGGFLFKLDANNKVKYCNIVYGSISADFVHARETENVLKGRDLFTDETLQMALKKLDEEIVPEEAPREPSAASRKTIALGLFYKAILSLAPAGTVSARYVSGGEELQRGVSRAEQIFDTDSKLWPLNQPLPKIEALAQCSGEVTYADDALPTGRDVHLAFVLSTVARADIRHIDAAQALKMPGVIRVLTAADIPGKNTFTPRGVVWLQEDEEVLCSSRVRYHGQPVALVAAADRSLALAAALRVKVTYTNVQKPILTIQEAIQAPDAKDRMREEVVITPTDRGTDIQHVLRGSFTVPSQYHYTMETQTCRAHVSEHGVHVTSATQWMDLVQVAVAQVLNLSENQVEVTVGSVGGGYGAKASRSALPACACALAALRLRRPARLHLPLTHNMHVIGMRQECLANYEVGVDGRGAVQYLEVQYYSECGWCYNNAAGATPGAQLSALYASARCGVRGHSVLTDKAGSTWCRAPGTNEGNAIIDHIMERIACAVGRDSSDIKLLNLSPKHDSLKEMMLAFKTDTDYEERRLQIEKFNRENAWKKRAIKLAAMSFPIEYFGNFSVTISVYHGDGTVAVSHAGVEMGQGINTKVAQVAAHTLRIPLDRIAVKPCNTFVSPNAMASNGSITSECVAYATVKACEELRRRLQPAADQLTETGSEPSWEELVKKAYDNDVNLCVMETCSSRDKLAGYSVAGVAVAEVELDALSGRHLLTRLDLLEDTGRSLNPDIDVGQIEGALMMGVGLWTCERLRYGVAGGEGGGGGEGALLTDRSWWYTPPGARDLPLRLRIAFQRNSLNTRGVLRSKATGEPALLLATSVGQALRHAAVAARHDVACHHVTRHDDASDVTADGWLHVDTPYSVEHLVTAIASDIRSFRLN